MNPADYLVYFNIAQQPFDGYFPGLCCALAAVIICYLAFADSGSKRILLLLGALIPLAFGALITFDLWSEYSRLRAQFQAQRLTMLEGSVTDFRRDSGAGKGDETFTIAGHRFALNSATGTTAFHKTMGFGGPDLSGGCILVGYVTDNDIDKIVWIGRRVSGHCADETSKDSSPSIATIDLPSRN